MDYKSVSAEVRLLAVDYEDSAAAIEARIPEWEDPEIAARAQRRVESIRWMGRCLGVAATTLEFEGNCHEAQGMEGAKGAR